MFDSPRSIIIAGAGIGGLTCAIACAKAGLEVTVAEQADHASDTGAGIQLGPNAMHVLAALGLGETLEAASFAPERAVFRRYTTGKPLLTTALNPEHEQRYGQKYLHIHRADLHSALAEAATALGVQLHFGQKARSVERSQGEVTLRCHGAEFTGDLVVGADGIHSVVRKTLAGSAEARFTGQVAWRGLIPANTLPANTLSPDANAWIGPGRHFVAYYVRGGTLVNFVAVREQSSWTEESWQTPGEIDEVRAAFRDWDPTIETLLSGADTCFRWGLFDRPALACWQDDRVVLLGDACHPMLPFMAQGAAMAIEDAWVLSALLTTSSTTVAMALERYEKIRQPRTADVHALSARNARIYHRSNQMSVALRDAGFAVASALPWTANLVLDKVYGLNVTETLV